MKIFFILLTLVMSFYAVAETDGELVKALEGQGFSSSDIEMIVKVVAERDSHMASKKNGVVKFYNEAKGFGLVFTEDGTYLTFAGSLELRKNDLIVFEVQEGKKGLNAVNVKKVVPVQDEMKGFSSLIR